MRRLLVVLAIAAVVTALAVPTAAQAAPPVPGERCSPTMKSRIVDVPGVGTLQCLKHWPKGPGIKRLMWLRVDSKITRRAAVLDARKFVQANWVGTKFQEWNCAKFIRSPEGAFRVMDDLASSSWTLNYPQTAARWGATVVVPELCGGKLPEHWDEWIEMGDPSPPE